MSKRKTIIKLAPMDTTPLQQGVPIKPTEITMNRLAYNIDYQRPPVPEYTYLFEDGYPTPETCAKISKDLSEDHRVKNLGITKVIVKIDQGTYDITNAIALTIGLKGPYGIQAFGFSPEILREVPFKDLFEDILTKVHLEPPIEGVPVKATMYNTSKWKRHHE